MHRPARIENDKIGPRKPAHLFQHRFRQRKRGIGQRGHHSGQAFFLPLAGITTVRQISENAFDIRATSRLNRLYVELWKDNPDWGKAERRHDMNHFMARLIFCFFAEDTNIFVAKGRFIDTIAQIGGAPVLIVPIVWLYWSGSPGWGTFLLAVGLLTATIDNVVRPILIKRGADLPLLLIFSGVIGGLVAFGLIGMPVTIARVIWVAALPISIWPQAMSYSRPSSDSERVSPVKACLVET